MEGYEKYLGRLFDNRYKIEQILGIGGMAVVYKATDILMKRTVSVKIIKEDIAHDEVSVKRFINESRAVAMLSHPNIVNIYDVSMHDNLKYIVMEYIEGITLKNYMTQKNGLSLSEIISYTEQILRALNHAHSKGIVHRDIKPQNIMLLKNGLIKVMDFGIAKLPNTETVTMTDKAIGTVYYISPEQASSGQIDARSDLYSLGVLMYEMVTGRLPFSGETAVSVALKQINDAPQPPHEIKPSVPQGLEQIIMMAMEKDPEHRYQSAAAILSHLLKLKENPKIIFRMPSKRIFKSDKPKKQRTGGRDSRSMFPIIMGVAAAFLIVAAISGVFVLTKFLESQDQSAANAETITVDTFVGWYYTDALRDYFADSDIYELTINYEYNGDTPDGYIIEQNPRPDSKKKIVRGESKCEITLTISRGAETVELPNYTAQEYRKVKLDLEAIGLKCRIENVNNDAFEAGHVIKTVPEAGSTMKINDTVTVYVSKGPAEGKIAVLNYTGKSEAAVLRSLIELELIPGKVTYVKDNAVAGTVIEQSVVPGKLVSKYTSIDFVVSGGPKYVEGQMPEIPSPDPDPTKDDTSDDPKDSISSWWPFDPNWPWITTEPTPPVDPEPTTDPDPTADPTSDPTTDSSSDSSSNMEPPTAEPPLTTEPDPTTGDSSSESDSSNSTPPTAEPEPTTDSEPTLPADPTTETEPTTETTPTGNGNSENPNSPATSENTGNDNTSSEE